MIWLVFEPPIEAYYGRGHGKASLHCQVAGVDWQESKTGTERGEERERELENEIGV